MLVIMLAEEFLSRQPLPVVADRNAAVVDDKIPFRPRAKTVFHGRVEDSFVKPADTLDKLHSHQPTGRHQIADLRESLRVLLDVFPRRTAPPP